MQPGNNYRVVASVVDQSMITGVQVTTSTAAKYLGPAFAQNAGVSASPLLTVWRRLWVENDSMAAIPVDAFGYKRNDLSWNLSSPKILTNLSDGTNTLFGIPTITDLSSFANLENGRIKLQNVEYPVIGTTLFGNTHFVQIAGDFSNIPLNSEFRIYDDDDYGLDAPPLPRLDLVNEFIKKLFRPAFIELIDSGGFNLDKIIPFKLNDDLQSQTLVNSKKDLIEKDALWVAPITAAYQFDQAEDGDPNDLVQTEGGTRKFGSSAHATVFIECCREPYDYSFRLANEQGASPQIGINALRDLKNQITAQSAHEIGHLPVIDALDQHLELGLMKSGGSSPAYPLLEIFYPKTISRFRKTKKWSNR